ncbi:MAG: twin-arginine translocation signal domain-containing protein, partial [Planctomycetota bacterium]
MPINRRQFLRATASGAAMCAAGCITDHVHQNLLYPIYLQGDLADAALAAAAAAGAEDASVRMVRCRAIRVQATSGGAVLAAEQSAFGAGVRAWVGGREGFAAGIDLNAARIAALMRQAVA